MGDPIQKYVFTCCSHNTERANSYDQEVQMLKAKVENF